MTEGPNAHLIADRMRTALAGQRLKRLVWASKDAAALTDALQARRVLNVECHGKELFVHLEGQQTFRIHLLMRGAVRIEPESTPAPSGIKLGFWARDKRVAVIGAPSIRLLSTREARDRMARLGPDAVKADFDAGRFRRNLQAQGPRSVAECLLDQEVVAGVGNMWKSEILFDAKLDPRTPANALDMRLRQRLATIVHAFLRGEYERKKRGLRTRLRVYHRTGKPCPVCGSPIEGYQLGGRSTYSCPTCQRAQRTV